MLEITRGKVNRAQKVVLYGPEGIGKSTIASLFPNPLFMDVEQGTDHLDTARTPKPVSFEMIRQITADVCRDPQGFQTLVIDTADWAERHAITEICASNNLSSLGGDKDYGKSFNLLEASWAKWLDSLTEICMTKGVHVVILAHAMMRKFEQPEEVGAFDRWEMKLQKKTSAVLKEWADMILFAGYKTLVVEEKKTKKGTGGARVLRTTHHPCWDAKNRHDLPDEIFLGPENKTALPAPLANIFIGPGPAAPPATSAAAEPSKPAPAPTAPAETVKPNPAPVQQPATQPPPAQEGPPIHTGLLQLMERDCISEKDLRRAVASRGHYPVETPVTNYDVGFIEGNIIAAWDKVKTVVNNLPLEG